MTKEEMANIKHNENLMKGETPGLSVFFKEGNEIFHTYSSKYFRNNDFLNGLLPRAIALLT
jgi:hypothetical protein